MKKGIRLGIYDENAHPIKNGDKVIVEFVNYMDTDKEYVDDIFFAEIDYNKGICAFVIYPISSDDRHPQMYMINHRSMRLYVINNETYQITPKYLSRIDHFIDVPQDRLLNLNYTYLHGDLEYMAFNRGGYDIYSFLDKVPTDDGIYLCDVLMKNTYIIKGIAFLWHDNRKEQHGLVVKVDDSSLLDAMTKYKEKRTML